jgi:hypothetical protein
MLSDENAITPFDPETVGGIDAHKEQFAQYHALYVDGIFSGLSNVLDLPASNVLKPYGITDPTLPIVIVVEILKETIGSVLEAIDNITNFILERLTTILLLFDDLLVWMFNIFNLGLDFNPIPFLIDLITALLNIGFPDLVQPVIDAINEKVDEIKQLIVDKIIEALNALAGLLPDPFPPAIPFIPFNLDLFNFNFNIDLDFLANLNLGLPWFDLSIFQLDAPPGILKLILEFIQGLLGMVADLVAQIIAEFTAFIQALKGGIAALLEFMINLVLDPIIEILKSIWPDISQYTIPVASFIAMLKKVIPMVIVGIVGLLLGNGLICLKLATELELIS